MCFRSQRTTCGSQFSLSVVWVLGIELRPLGLEVNISAEPCLWSSTPPPTVLNLSINLNHEYMFIQKRDWRHCILQLGNTYGFRHSKSENVSLANKRALYISQFVWHEGSRGATWQVVSLDEESVHPHQNQGRTGYLGC